jgi:hypothetical protein
MPRPMDKADSRQLLLSQLENYKATRESCREPQRSIFTALIEQIERELSDISPISQADSISPPEGSAA